MLTAIRNSARSWVVKALLGLIVLTFVISFGVGTFSNPKEVLVKVGAGEIMVSQYLQRYQQEMDDLRRRYPDNADVLAKQLNLRHQVMERMIDRHLILRAARDEGLIVTESELRDTITQDPSFSVNGKFDYGTYEQILQQIRRTPEIHESIMREDLLVNRFQRNLVAGVIVNDAEVDERYRIENQRVEVDYVLVDPNRFDLPKPLGDAEIKTYHEAHPLEFTQQDQFKVRYFIYSLADAEEGEKVHPRAVKRYYERKLDTEFSIPKKVRASHILKRLAKDDPPEKALKLRVEMEKILARAKKGEDFARLAKAHSEDFSKDKGGDLGFFAQEEMVPTFAEVAFSLPMDGVSEIVRSPFGLHIIKITGVQPGSQKTFEEVKEAIEGKLLERLSERKLNLEVERLPPRIEKEGLEAVAKSFGKSVQTTKLFDRASQLPGIGSTARLYAQARTRRKGDAGVLQRNPVQGHLFFEVVEKKPSYVKPLDEVKLQAMRLATAEKQREMALAEAKEKAKSLKTGKDFNSYAIRRSLDVKTTAFTVVDAAIELLGRNPDFQRSAFRLTSDESVALNIQDGKAYLMRFRRRYFPEPEKEKEIKAQVRTRMTSEFRQYIAKNEIDRLRSSVDIEVVSPQYVGTGRPTRP